MNKGNAINKNTIVRENIAIKALWKGPYNCSADCTPIDNGSKCTREKTASIIKVNSCPSGYSGTGNICKIIETIDCVAN